MSNNIKVYMKELGGASWTDVSSSCLKTNFIIREGFGALGSASDVSKLSIEYKADDLASATLFHTTSKAIRVSVDGITRFEGYTEGNASIKTTNSIGLAWVKLSAFPYAKAFEESYAPAEEILSGYKVLDSTDPEHSLVHVLLAKIQNHLPEPYKTAIAYYGYSIATSENIGATANPVLIEEGESYLEVLDALLGEFGLVRYVSNNYIRIAKPYVENKPITSIGYNDILINPSFSTKPYKKEKSPIVTVGKVVSYDNELVYRLRKEDEETPEDEKIEAGTLYPADGNLQADYSSDRENDDVSFLFAEGLSFDYLATTEGGAPVNLNTPVMELGNTSALFRFQNLSSNYAYLRQLKITASKAYYKDTSLTVEETESKARERDDIESRFISTSEQASNYIAYLHSESLSERFAATFESGKINLSPASVARIGDIPFSILIRYVEEDLATGIVKYSGVAYDVQPISTTSTVRRQTASSSESTQYISLALDGFAYTYNSDGNLDPADQIITATVKRYGIVDEPVWTVNGTVQQTRELSIQLPASLIDERTNVSVSVSCGEYEASSFIYKIQQGKDAIAKTSLEIIPPTDPLILSARGIALYSQEFKFGVRKSGDAENEDVAWSYRIDNEDAVYPGDKGDNLIVTVNEGDKLQKITVTAKTESTQPAYSIIEARLTGRDAPLRYGTVNASADSLSKTNLPDGTPLAIGDYALVKTESNEYIPFRFSGGDAGWVQLNSSFPEYATAMANMLPDVLAGANADPSVNAFYGYFQSLVSQDAVINKLSVGTSMQSSNFDGGDDPSKESETFTQGWKANANTGNMMAVGMIAKGLKATEAEITGSIEHPALITHKASSDTSAKTSAGSLSLWSIDTLFKSTWAFKNSGKNWRNSWRSASVSYLGKSYSKFYNKNWTGQPVDSNTSVTRTIHVGKASGGNIIDTTVASLFSEKATLEANDPVYLELYCNGATTTFNFYINGSANKQFDKKSDGVAVFRGWIRPADSVRVYGYNSNIFNERDISCRATIAHFGYPLYPLTSAPMDCVPATTTINSPQSMSYIEWEAPQGLVNKCAVTFNANIYSGYDRTCALYVDGKEVANTENLNTGWYNINWVASVPAGKKVRLECYGLYIPPDGDGFGEASYYCNAYGVNCAFGYATDERAIFMQDDSGNSASIAYYPESIPEGWSTESISFGNAGGTHSLVRMKGDSVIDAAKSQFGKGEFNLNPGNSRITVNETSGVAVDRISVSDNSLMFRREIDKGWLTITRYASMGIYTALSYSVYKMSSIESIETSSIIPHSHNAYQIGQGDKYFGTSYIVTMNGTNLTISGTTNITGGGTINGPAVYGAVFN